MTRTPDPDAEASRFPVDPTGPLTRGSIPADELGPLLATIPAAGDDQDDDAASGTCGYWPTDASSEQQTVQTADGARWIARTFRPALFPEDYVKVSVEHFPATWFSPERRGVRIVAHSDNFDGIPEWDAEPVVVVLDWDTARRLAHHILTATDTLGGAR